MSARLSYSLPKGLSVRVQRATRPSSPSNIMAMNTALPASAKLRIDGGDDGIETGEQAARGEQIGQQVDAPPRRIVIRFLGVLVLGRHGRHHRRIPHLIHSRAPMRWSQYPVNTTKETPAEADVVSHQLMLRAGLIRRLAAGLYTWLPLGLRALRKVESVVREEMNRAGALELLMPGIIPAELWQESGRWDKFGPELLRLKDRHERDFCLGPTHEEVITDIARNELKSYRQLPVNFYQIQMKFRDERRPRFGVMRAREFLMKDAYSFHLDEASLQATYDAMHDAYTAIFTRMGLKFRSVVADPGAIGGSGSEEFHVLADSGEDAIAFSDGDDYAANLEMAVAAAARHAARRAPRWRSWKSPRPTRSTIDEVTRQLKLPADQAGQDPAGRWQRWRRGGAAAARRSRAQRSQGAEAAAASRIRCAWLQRSHRLGYGRGGRVSRAAGLQGQGVRRSLPWSPLSDFVCGANKKDAHLTGVNWGRDLPEPTAGRHPQRGRGRPHARARARCPSRAASRWVTSSSSARNTARPWAPRCWTNPARPATLVHGLLRHRCDARRCRGHRAEPRCSAASSGRTPSRRSRWCSSPSTRRNRPLSVKPQNASTTSSWPQASKSSRRPRRASRRQVRGCGAPRHSAPRGRGRARARRRQARIPPPARRSRRRISARPTRSASSATRGGLTI